MGECSETRSLVPIQKKPSCKPSTFWLEKTKVSSPRMSSVNCLPLKPTVSPTPSSTRCSKLHRSTPPANSTTNHFATSSPTVRMKATSNKLLLYRAAHFCRGGQGEDDDDGDGFKHHQKRVIEPGLFSRNGEHQTASSSTWFPPPSSGSFFFFNNNCLSFADLVDPNLDKLSATTHTFACCLYTIVCCLPPPVVRCEHLNLQQPLFNQCLVSYKLCSSFK